MRLLIVGLGLSLLCRLCFAEERIEKCVTNSFLSNAMTNRWLSGKDGVNRLRLEKDFGVPTILVNKIFTNQFLQNTYVYSVSVQTVRISSPDDFTKRETYAVVYNGQDVVFVESDSDAVKFVNKASRLTDNLLVHATQAVLFFGELRGYTLGTKPAGLIIETNDTVSAWSFVMREEAEGCSVSASFFVSPSKIVRKCVRYLFAFNSDGQMVLVKQEKL